jgi:hypothetical protein
MPEPVLAKPSQDFSAGSPAAASSCFSLRCVPESSPRET